MESASSVHTNGLGSFEGLDLGLLVHARHDGLLGRGQVPPDHVPHLLHDVRVGGPLERVGPVRLEAERPPDAAGGGLRQPAVPRHASCAPVGGVRGLGFQGLGDDPFDIVVGYRARGAGARFVGPSFEPSGDEPIAPRADGGGAHALLHGYGRVARFIDAGQDDSSAEREALGTLGPVGPPRQGLPLVVGQHQCGLRARQDGLRFLEAVAIWRAPTSTPSYATDF